MRILANESSLDGIDREAKTLWAAISGRMADIEADAHEVAVILSLAVDQVLIERQAQTGEDLHTYFLGHLRLVLKWRGQNTTMSG